MTGVALNNWAAAVHTVLNDRMNAGLTTSVPGSDLANLCNITYMQMCQGVAHIRDEYPHLPMISSKQGYRYSREPSIVAAFRRERARYATTVMRRLLTGAIIPFLRLQGDTAANRQTQRMYERVVEDLEALITT